MKAEIKAQKTEFYVLQEFDIFSSIIGIIKVKKGEPDISSKLIQAINDHFPDIKNATIVDFKMNTHNYTYEAEIQADDDGEETLISISLSGAALY